MNKYKYLNPDVSKSLCLMDNLIQQSNNFITVKQNTFMSDLDWIISLYTQKNEFHIFDTEKKLPKNRNFGPHFM